MDDAVRRLILGCRCKCCEKKRKQAEEARERQPAPSRPQAPQGLWQAEAVGNWPDIPDPVFVPSSTGIYSPQLPRTLGNNFTFVPETTFTEDGEALRRGDLETPGAPGFTLHTIITDGGRDHGDMYDWQTVDHHLRVCRNRSLTYSYGEDTDLAPFLTEELGPLNPETPWAPWSYQRMLYPEIRGTLTRVVAEFNYVRRLSAFDDVLTYSDGELDATESILETIPLIAAKLVEIQPVDAQGRLGVIVLQKGIVNLSESGPPDPHIVYHVLLRVTIDGAPSDSIITGWGRPVTFNGGPVESQASGGPSLYVIGRYDAMLDAETADEVVVSGPILTVLADGNAHQTGDQVITGIKTPANLAYYAVNTLELDTSAASAPQPQLIYRNVQVWTGETPRATVGNRTVDLSGNHGWEALELWHPDRALLLWLDADYQLHVSDAVEDRTVTTEELQALLQLPAPDDIVSLLGTPAFHTPARRAYLEVLNSGTGVLAAWHPWRDGDRKVWSKQGMRRPKTWEKWLEHRADDLPVPEPPGLPIILADLMPAPPQPAPGGV